MTSLTPLTDADFAIGKEVRVVACGTGDSGSRRGMISYINDNTTVDVIFQSNNKQEDDEEENGVCRDRLFDILPFETDPLSSLEQPSVIKEYANQLFQLQDYDTAYQYYIRAHKLIQQQENSFNTGQRLIISLPSDRNSEQTVKKSDSSQKQRSGVYMCVTVSDVIHPSKVDVMYDEEWQGADEEEGVPECRVLLVVSHETGVIGFQATHCA